jgi:hypothetical protein
MRKVATGIGAILAGLAGGMVAVIVLTWVAVQAFFGGDMNAPPTGPYLVVNITYSLGAAMLAGWLAGRLAGSRPLLHAAGVALLMLVLSIGDGSAPGASVPAWYGPALMVLMPAGALLGGWLRARSVGESITA